MFITVTDLSKHFEAHSGRRGPRRGVHHALRGVSLSVEEGEMITLVGPSGSGKTSLLRCLAGLEAPSSGEISMVGRVVYSGAARVNVPTHSRDVGMVFQSYALWPHMTVRQNLLYPLRRHRVPVTDREERVRRYLRVMECEALADRYPHQLSGGQQQRVALARALVYEPRIVLFDEPLSNLDAGLREQLRYEIRRIQQSLGFTGVYVTHDRREAFTIGDRCAVLLGGELPQYGTPAELFAQPADAAVAAFLGATNTIDGDLRRVDGAWQVVTAAGTLPVKRPPTPAAPGPVRLMARPDAVRVTAPDPAGPRGLAGTVVDRLAVEYHLEYQVDIGSAQPWRVRVPADGVGFDRPDRIEVVVAAESMLLYPGTTPVTP